jgi:hypothetical protein
MSMVSCWLRQSTPRVPFLAAQSGSSWRWRWGGAVGAASAGLQAPAGHRAPTSRHAPPQWLRVLPWETPCKWLSGLGGNVVDSLAISLASAHSYAMAALAGISQCGHSGPGIRSGWCAGTHRPGGQGVRFKGMRKAFSVPRLFLPLLLS